MKIIGIIPARYASTRFPGKPLVMINGKSMIQRVYEQSVSCKALQSVTVATDDERIFEHVNSFGGNCVITHVDHASGTDRCFEAAQKLSCQSSDIILNIQGDEPYIAAAQIELLCSAFNNKDTQIATLIKKVENAADLGNVNSPKVVIDKAGKALLFSRRTIPFIRNCSDQEALVHHVFYKHIGLYAFRFDTLSEITKLSTSSLELAEGLEQLRWLENGYPIQTLITEMETIAIDTPEDLDKINA